MQSELIITIAPAEFNVFQCIKYIWFTGMVILFGIFINKIILQITDYLAKQQKQIELNNSGMSHIAFMNRNSVRLLDETDEEFELKILQHILYELQDKYVIYKQIEFYTKPLEK